RGIHDVFHSSLLKLHVPNDDRQFPGCLYDQIISKNKPEHETEWAADKIVSHSGSKTDAIFEVLWHAGNKTWLPYDQVRELDLLSPYFDAQGNNKISELENRTGSPPVNDPQVYLGSVSIEHINAPSRLHINNHTGAPPSDFIKFLSLSHSLLPSLILHQHSLSVMSSYHPKDHYNPHPSLAPCANGFIQLTSIDPNIIIHPANS
ncbi:hypothetical protein J132_09291, partial [Termitomyces sp. J132]